ncbi:glutamate receptor ionotropic, kainate 4-like, partial [Panulirus ornatus]|uniref:glutamate receptor ionotropic, kainate 4-like n=1 Tax=Panulirus ornatus TaxID=150431 RepID=UPI003A87F756
MAIFQTTAEGHNVTHEQLSMVLSHSRRLRQVSWCLTVVVVSDDPAFLTAFLEGFSKGRVLAWPTRVLAVTRLPYQSLRNLHKTFSMTNAMMFIVENHSGNIKFLQRPTLTVVSEESPINRLVRKDDSKNRPQGSQPAFRGPVPKLLNYLSTGLNFSYTYVRPSDGAWGSKQGDGSWSGMVGMIMRGEADLGAEVFSVHAARAAVVDFTYPVVIVYLRIIGDRGLPEVDPWGFLLPLTPLVWASTLVTLVVLPTVVVLLASWSSLKTVVVQGSWLQNTFVFIRVLLQQ